MTHFVVFGIKKNNFNIHNIFLFNVLLSQLFCQPLKEKIKKNIINALKFLCMAFNIK